jgi:hypothetical protein
MSRKRNGISEIEVAEAGEPDILWLSRTVSEACDRFLRKRGLMLERGGWGPARKRTEPAAKTNNHKNREPVP